MWEEFIRQTDKNSVLLGDFNLPGIDWTAGTEVGGRERQFQQAFEEAGLDQFVNFPTQVRGNTLDLILTNVPDRVVEVKEVGRLGKSDHVMIRASIDISRKGVRTTEMVPT